MTLSQEQYVVDSNGTKTAVILTIEQYEELLEDLHDLAIVAERRSEQSISLATLKARLKRDATL
jgi:PHD/YefM family antitoxin component YafN of YafNO toxin-antitoxin module